MKIRKIVYEWSERQIKNKILFWKTCLSSKITMFELAICWLLCYLSDRPHFLTYMHHIIDMEYHSSYVHFNFVKDYYTWWSITTTYINNFYRISCSINICKLAYIFLTRQDIRKQKMFFQMCSTIMYAL